MGCRSVATSVLLILPTQKQYTENYKKEYLIPEFNLRDPGCVTRRLAWQLYNRDMYCHYYYYYY